MSASSPRTSGSSGISSASSRPRRIASAAEVLADEPLARAGRVALVEDEVDDRQHGPKTIGQVGLMRDAVRDPRVADLSLGADQPLRHRRLGDKKGARDLRRGQPSQQPKGQRDLGAGSERRMTAGEDQAQPVVSARRPPLRQVAFAAYKQSGLGVPVVTGRLPTQAIDRAVAGRRDDPPAGLGGSPADGQRSTAAVNASWTASSARSMSPRTRTRTATARPYSSRNTRAISDAGRSGITERRRTGAPRSAAERPGRVCGPSPARRRDRRR